MRRSNNSQPSGCLGNIFKLLFVFIGALTLFISIYYLAPFVENAVESNFCQDETIQSEFMGRGKMKKVTCLDKKTGKKVDVSILQFSQCCPTIILIVLLAFTGIFTIFILKQIRKQDGIGNKRN